MYVSNLKSPKIEKKRLKVTNEEKMFKYENAKWLNPMQLNQ